MDKNDSLLVQRVSLVDAVMEQMTDAVKCGRFRPGDKIPSEKVLAQEFGVSRATLREAFKRLESAGMLDIKQGNGTYLQAGALFDEANENITCNKADAGVKTTETPQINAFRSSVGSNISLSDYLDAREALEVEAAELAALRRTSEDLNRLAKIIEMQEQVMDQRVLFADMDLIFHSALMEISGSKVICSFWNSLAPKMREQVKASLAIEGVAKSALDAHKMIYKLIESNEDSLVLRTTIVEHIRIVPGRFFFR